MKIYYHAQSPPSQTVRMTLKELGVAHEEEVIDLLAGEQKSEKFKEINPYQKVPALVDGDLKLSESKAICIYLCTKYEPKDKEGKLYPKDAVEAAKMNMMIFHGIDNTSSIIKYMNGEAIYTGKATGPIQEHFPKVEAVLKEMDENLSKRKYMWGDHITLMDFFCLDCLALLEMTGSDGYCTYPNLQRWKKLMAELPYYDECYGKPAQMNAEFYKTLCQKAAAALEQK